MKRIWILPGVLLILYAVLALPNIPAALKAKKVDSGVTYRDFARRFKQIESGWTEERVVATFGKPDLIRTNEAGARGLEYRWCNVRIDIFLQPYSIASGGVNVWFRNGRMIGTGWSDSIDDADANQPSQPIAGKPGSG